MKPVVCSFALLLASLGFAQQQGPPSTSPPYQTPPTFPEGQQTPREQIPRTQMPPDTQAPPPQTMSTERVEQQITQHLSSEPALAKTNVDAKVDESSVVLTGSVDTETQHDLAVRIAQSFAGDRKLVDKIKVRQQTSHATGGPKKIKAQAPRFRSAVEVQKLAGLSSLSIDLTLRGNNFNPGRACRNAEARYQ